MPICKNRTALKCPECNSDNHEGEVEFVETVPSCRNIHGVINGVVFIDDESEEVWDDAYNQTLHCRNCGSNWDIPRSNEYVSATEFRRRSEAAP